MSSAATTTAEFVRRMVKNESGGWGDESQALRRIARECRVSFWTLNNLRIGRAKTVDGDVRDRVRDFFVMHCREHAARLLHDAQMAEVRNEDNDALRDIENQIRALAARLEAAAPDQSREALK